MTGAEEEKKEQTDTPHEAAPKQPARERIREGFFSPRPCVHTQVLHIITNKQLFVAELETLYAKGAIRDLSQAAKSRILAALQMTSETEAAKRFLQHCDVVEILKACQILDRPRQMRQVQKRIDEIQTTHPHLADGASKNAKRGRSKGLYQYQTQLNDLKGKINESHTADMPCHEAHEHPAVQEVIASASLSGSFAKKIRGWAGTLPCGLLEFVVLSGSMECWKELADLVHFKPNDFQLPYFMSVVHEGTPEAAPEGSFVHGLLSLCGAPEESLVESFVALAKHHSQVFNSYSYLRTQASRLLQEKQVCRMLAEKMPLGTLIWYLDDMESTAEADGELARIAATRLKSEQGWLDETSKVTESFGKLLERVLEFQSRGWLEVAEQLMPAARRKLNSLRETWVSESGRTDGLTVVIGDKSGSMEQAIRSASIIATMISACFDAELYFVDSEIWPSPCPKPCTAEEVLEICRSVKAEGDTCLSAALWPFYEKRKKIDRLVVVSDENDLTKCQGLNFGQLVRKYREEVWEGMELVMVSVGEGCWSMFRDFSDENVEHRRITIDPKRPDLSKFDAMVSRIALLSKSSTEGDLERVKREWKEIEALSFQLYERIAEAGPRVTNPYVNTHYPGESLYAKINGQFLILENEDGKSFSMNRSLLRQSLEDRACFRANLAVVLDFLERWQGEEVC